MEFFFFFSFKTYFPKHAWQDFALLFSHNIRCFLLANLELNTAQIIEKSMHAQKAVCTCTSPAHKLSAILPGDCVCIIDGDGVTVL